jgi:DNA (cytosine-5)-methyltransferase 1
MATIQGYLRALTILRPKAFILENVAGFTFRNQKQAFDLVKESAESLGYNCSWKVLNAADYGVPQIRQRFFMIGVSEGSFSFPEPTHFEKNADWDDNRNEQAWVTAGDAISDLDTDENASDEGHFAGGKHHDLLKQVPPGENYLFFTEKRGHPKPVFRWRSRYWSFLLKLSPNLPSWTIQARRSNNMGPLHWRNRILRIEEVKRLQTFPDDFHLAGRIEQKWHQIGNAVPPMLAEVLGRSLKEHLLNAKYAGGANKDRATNLT